MASIALGKQASFPRLRDDGAKGPRLRLAAIKVLHCRSLAMTSRSTTISMMGELDISLPKAVKDLVWWSGEQFWTWRCSQNGYASISSAVERCANMLKIAPRAPITTTTAMVIPVATATTV